MSPLLSTHLARGIIAAVPVFIVSTAATLDIKFGATVAGITAVAVIAFSLIATAFSPLFAGACVGAGLGALFGAIKPIHFSNDRLFNIFLGAGIGAAAGFVSVGFFQLLMSVKVSGYAFVNGQFVPVFAPK